MFNRSVPASWWFRDFFSLGSCSSSSQHSLSCSAFLYQVSSQSTCSLLVVRWVLVHSTQARKHWAVWLGFNWVFNTKQGYQDMIRKYEHINISSNRVSSVLSSHWQLNKMLTLSHKSGNGPRERLYLAQPPTLVHKQPCAGMLGSPNSGGSPTNWPKVGWTELGCYLISEMVNYFHCWRINLFFTTLNRNYKQTTPRHR